MPDFRVSGFGLQNRVEMLVGPTARVSGFGFRVKKSGQDLGDTALHDEEVRVVDVQLHRVEHVLHPVLGVGA